MQNCRRTSLFWKITGLSYLKDRCVCNMKKIVKYARLMCYSMIAMCILLNASGNLMLRRSGMGDVGMPGCVSFAMWSCGIASAACIAVALWPGHVSSMRKGVIIAEITYSVVAITLLTQLCIMYDVIP